MGDELFLTGKDTPIYFPCAQHAVVRYGDKVKHYATAVPKGEGRYVMNRLDGKISLECGPKMLLPDPRTQVIVRRILTDKQVNLWYPDNTEALLINRNLTEEAQTKGMENTGYITHDTSDMMSMASSMAYGELRSAYSMRSSSPTKLIGDSMKRSDTYTPPRSITLNTKYDGAVQVDVWTGYACLVVDKNGNREVIVGPQTKLLEFDQSLAAMAFSTGKPKTADKLYQTAFLRVLNNQVSDIVDVITSDDIPVKIKTSYRVNFNPEYKDKWFNVENYVKLLCDHVRSKLRNEAKKYGIQEFTDKYIDLVRDTVLGPSSIGVNGVKVPRPGLLFQENGAHIYDVEVLGLDVGDRQIAEQLVNAQRQTIQDSLKLDASKRQLMLAEEQETINQTLEAIRATTIIQKSQLQKKVLDETNKVTMAELARDTEIYKNKQSVEVEKQKVVDIANQSELDRSKLGAEQELAKQKEQLAIQLQQLEAETKSLASRTAAVTPDLIAAMQRFSDTALVEKMADSMAPMALLGGKSVAEVLGKLLQGTGLEKLATGMALGSVVSGNGSGNRMAALSK